MGNWSGTFVNALLYHCSSISSLIETPSGDQSVRPGIVHRLDKETSGVLIAAKNALAQERLCQLFLSKEIHKEYLAIAVGNPGEGSIDFPREKSFLLSRMLLFQG